MSTPPPSRERMEQDLMAWADSSGILEEVELDLQLLEEWEIEKLWREFCEK